MIWQIEIDDDLKKDLKKLDRKIQKRIFDFLYNRVLPSDNPRLFGKKLTGRFAKYWAYRVGDYRIIADIKDDRLIILIVDVDHRRQVYE